MTATLDLKPVLTNAPTPDPSLPQWFQDLQANAWQRFQELPLPGRKDENWRFAKLKKLDFNAFVAAPALDDTDNLVQRSVGLAKTSAKFIFANEQLIATEASLPEGVICLPLKEALTSHSDLVQSYFMQHETRLGSAKFTALHAAHLSSGLFVYVPANVELSEPIEVYHWLGGENSTIFPHTLVVTGDNAKVKVLDYIQSVDTTSPGLSIGVNDLVAGPGSKLDYLAIQNLNEFSKAIQVNTTIVERDANATSFQLNLGATWARNESLSKLVAAGANSDMLSISIPSSDQEYDQRTFQHHAAAHTTSDLLYKNSLYDQARTIFSGLIFVDEGAHYTDAYQTCRNLLMSNTTEANSMPGLEINADQVKCSHGSTSARISDEEIYYLCARGIAPDHARQLIARGFSVEVIEKLNDPQLEELTLKLVDQKFKQITSPTH